MPTKLRYTPFNRDGRERRLPARSISPRKSGCFTSRLHDRTLLFERSFGVRGEPTGTPRTPNFTHRNSQYLPERRVHELTELFRLDPE